MLAVSSLETTMKRTWPATLLPALLVLLSPTTAQARLKPAAAPTATRTVRLPPPSRSHADDSSQAAANARLQERLRQPALHSEPAARLKPLPKAQARPVYDGRGRALQGMQQAGPDRVLDTRTGRYHRTVPSGDGQRIID